MKTSSTIKRAAITLLAVALTTTAWALRGGGQSTDYQDVVDNSFVPRQKDAMPLTGGETMLNAGWYVVNSNISFTQPIQLLGDVNIILADGCTMTMGTNQNRLGAFGFFGSAGSIVCSRGTDYDLTIYGQEGQSGVLEIWGPTHNANYSCIKVQDLFVYGGNIRLNGFNGISTRGHFDNYVNIYRGTVNVATTNNQGKAIDSYHVGMSGGALNISGLGSNAVYSNRFSMSGGTLNVNDSGNVYSSDATNGTFEMTGGYLYVNGTNKGVYAPTVTFGLTHDDDLIYANNYFESTVKVATGKVLMDNQQTPAYYLNTLTDEQKATIKGKVLKSARFNGNGTQIDPYTIYTTEGWNTFCSMITTTENGLSDIYVKLGTDISVTTMAGTSDKPFKGIFNGDGHTLTVNYHVDNEDFIAPFRFVDGATIQNLNVEGTIYASAMKAAGIIGQVISAKSTITNCRVGANITDGNETGGFVATGLVEIDHCVFNGSFGSSYYHYGFVGNSISGDNIISNCLFDPQPGSAYENTYYTGTTPQILNCYNSEQVKADNKDDGQAKLAYRIIADALANMTLKSSNTNGVQFGSTCYAANGEEISLTLADPSTAHTGYTASPEGYSATAGNLSGSGTDYTLTMPVPGAEVFISCYSPITYDITYYPGEGATFSQTKYNYNIESEDIVLDTPTKEGSRFMGWYTNGEYTGSPVTTIPKGSTGNKDFYAKWEVINTSTKSLATCKVTMPNQSLGDTYIKIHEKFGNANSGDEYCGETIKDGQTTTLTLGTDYRFGGIQDIHYYDPNRTPSYQDTGEDKPGDELVVTIYGMGDYAGTSTTVCFMIVPENNSGTWGDLTWYIIYSDSYTGTLFIKPTKPGSSVAMQTAGSNEVYPWYNYKNIIESIVIGEGVTSIASNAFAGTFYQDQCYSKVNSVSLPSTLESIGDNAFSYCTALTIDLDKDIPSGVTIGTSAFNQVGTIIGSLSNTGNNNEVINILSTATTTQVTLAGRILYKDGKWNTLCLPFGVKDGDPDDGITFSNTPLEGATVMELDVDGYYDAQNTRYDDAAEGRKQTGLDGSTLNVYFKETKIIEPGNPYLIKWNNDGTTLTETDLMFSNSEKVYTETYYITSEDKLFSFRGTYEQIQFEDGKVDKSILFLGDDSNNNVLYYPNGSNVTTIGAQHAYFKLETQNTVRDFNLFFGNNDEASGITTLTAESTSQENCAWYDLNGRRINALPTAKGIYIHNGRKVIVK